MDSELINILEQFRDNDNPVLGSADADTPLQTLSKSELLSEFEKIGIDGLRLCRLGNIDPRPEIMCRLLHYGPVSSKKRERVNSELEPQAKKYKKESVTVSVDKFCIFGMRKRVACDFLFRDK